MEGLKEHLASYLDHLRGAVLWKAKGLSDQELTRPMVPTGTNILGLVQHLGFMEYGYFVQCLGFSVQDEHYAALTASRDDSADMWVPAEVPCAKVLDFYRRAVAAANRNIGALSLDAPATVPWWPEEKRHTTLGRLMVHMNVETARHAGHLDIVRELIDGSVGMRAENTSMPPLGDAGWAQLHEKILRASESR